MSSTTMKVEEQSIINAPEASQDSSTSEFQEKYYPVLATSINKYDPYSLQSTIDAELITVSCQSDLVAKS